VTYLDSIIQSSSLHTTLKKNSDAVETAMKSLLSRIQSSKLKEAAFFSCFDNTGKKLRPSLCIEFTKLLNGSIDIIMPVAASIEICHTYSLIHDDLPALDNDDIRRGKQSCHKKFDEATAILTGDTLLTYAFEILSGLKNITPEKKCILVSEFAKSVGPNGMLAGQIEDIECSDSENNFNKMLNIHKLKTAKLIEFSCLAPTFVFDTDEKIKNAISIFASNFGILFQIADDILDYNQNSEEGCNIVKALGANKSKEMLKDLAEKSTLSLDIFGNSASILKSLVFHTVDRIK
jgi:geranylgeranyl pyrophosphate synthase